MPLKGWYSKKDVINDLSKVTGAMFDLDEEYVIVGERPPPFIRTMDAEQELHLLRLYGRHEVPSPSSINIDNTPDYEGITDMLRMVEQYNDVPDERTVSETKKLSTITISKLNPNVDEFAPCNVNNDNFNIPTDVNSTVDLNVDDKDTFKMENIKKIERRDKSVTVTNSVGTSSVESSDDIRDLRHKLISNISDTPDVSCVKVKKERNLAIPMLLKLHTQPNAAERPKLITPDYFMRGLSQKDDSGQGRASGACSNECVTEDIGLEVNSPVDISTVTNMRETVDTGGSLLENLNNSNESISKEIKESIQKVDDWLNSKTETRSIAASSSPKPSSQHSTAHTAYFGPIKFKRKNNKKTSSSPVSNETDRIIQKECNVFVPSTFAAELTRKYEERSKLMENTKEDIWTKVEKQLKARDEIILKKHLENNGIL